MPKKSTAVSPMMNKLSAAFAAAVQRPAADRRDRLDAKLHLVDTFAAMISGSRLLPGRQSDRLRENARRQARGRHYRHAHRHDAAKCRARQRHVRPCRRNRRHASAFAHASGHERRAGGARHGEQHRLPGRAVLRAIVLGYDICARTLLTLKPMPLPALRSSCGATGQLFGAAATAGALLNLDAQQIRFTLSYAGQQTAGLYTMFRDPEHIEKLMRWAACRRTTARRRADGGARLDGRRGYFFRRARFLFHVRTGRSRSRRNGARTWTRVRNHACGGSSAGRSAGRSRDPCMCCVI